MKKVIGKKKEQIFEINSFAIHTYIFRNPDYGNLDAARIDVYFSLGQDKDGKFTPSPYKEHNGIELQIYNSGDQKFLTSFLENSRGGKEDLFDFDYNDLMRIIEPFVTKMIEDME